MINAKLQILLLTVIFLLLSGQISSEDTPDCAEHFSLIGTRCVHLCTEKKRSLYETKDYCKTKDAKLLKVQDEGDNQAIKSLIGEDNWGWIGANITFAEDDEGAYSGAITYYDGSSDYVRKYEPAKCSWNGCCVKMSGAAMDIDWAAADCRQRTAYSLCEAASANGDNEIEGLDGSTLTSSKLTQKGANGDEDDEDETYSPEECLNKMRGDIHDMLALIEKVKVADPTIRFVLDGEYVLVTNAENGTISRVVN